MFIRLMKCGKNRSKVLLVEGYRDQFGKSKQRRLKDYGYYDELTKDNPDIMEKLQVEAKKLSEKAKAQIVSVMLSNTQPNCGSEKFQWYSTEIISAIYESLGLNDLCKRRNNMSNYRYDLDEALRLFVFGRLLDPASKLSTLEMATDILPDCHLSEDDIYHSLDEICEISQKAQRRIYKRIREIYGLDMTVIFYDVTNYYFETDTGDEFRKRGASKENRKDNPLVAMGLLLNSDGSPVAYGIFPGNTHDSKTLEPTIAHLKKEYSVGRVIIVADKGINAKDNFLSLLDKGDGYIVSEKVRGASADLKAWVTDESDWIKDTDGRKYKTKLRTRTVVTTHNSTKRQVAISERLIVVYSEKYRERDRARRAQVVDYLQQYIDNPARYNAALHKGSKKYLDVHEVDIATGEIDKGTTTLITINESKLAEDTALDGFYCIVTSETDMAVPEVLERYAGLWRIEESFRVIKSELKGRPIFVRNESHIRAHFLICFIALVIGRIIQRRCGFSLCAEQVLDALRSARCHHLGNGLYHIEPQTKELRTVFSAFDTELDKTNASITDIREFGRKAKTSALVWENTTEIVR